MRTQHRCSRCGYATSKWFGRCPECGGWDSAEAASEVGGAGPTVRSLSEVSAARGARIASGIAELDRVLGGGIVPGSVVLVAGEPGIGKSTLLLQAAAGLIHAGARALLVTGEEALDQVAARAHRVGVDPARILATATTSRAAIERAALTSDASVVVVDSIQTLVDDNNGSAAGSVTQVRECAAALARFAKERGIAVVLVGHVTKDGNVAGPKTLEHLVDVVLSLEGERTGTLRLLRAMKNRYGACDETGVFVMDGDGLQVVVDPSEMLLADRRDGVPGSVVFPAVQGTRPVLMEIQALLTAAADEQRPRRVAIGIDGRRLTLVLGVLASRAGLRFSNKDVFVAASGGAVTNEPASDLAVALALVSADQDLVVARGTAVFGELGLTGEVRRAQAGDRRAAEAARLGFDTLVCGNDIKTRADQVVNRVQDLEHAIMSVRTRGARAETSSFNQDACVTIVSGTLR